MNNKIIAIVCALLSLSTAEVRAKASIMEGRECVILLHGLARSERSMKKIEKELSKAGYQAVNESYPSRKHDIETLAPMAIDNALPLCQSAKKIHFVTHSMGGILVREYLKERSIENLGRVVMLGPPNQGSELADFYGKNAMVSRVGGPAFLQLKREQGYPEALGPVDFDLGVIAGDRSMNLIMSMMLPGADDGKVCVESTKVDGMNSHLVLHTTHPFMLYNKKVIKQALHFLQNGNFKTAQ